MYITVVCQGFSHLSKTRQPWNFVYEVSKRMMERGLEVHIVTDRAPTQPQSEILDGIHVFRVGHFTSRFLIGKGKLVKSITRNNPDAVIWVGSPLSVLYLAVMKKVNKPIIWFVPNNYSLKTFKKISIRELFSPHHQLFFLPVLITLCPKFLIRNAANSAIIRKILVPTHYLKDSLLRIEVQETKIMIMPPAFSRMSSKETIVNGLREKLGFKAIDFVVIYAGSPCTLRGTDTLIRSMTKILRSLKNVKLIILSRRELQKFDREQVSLEREEEYLCDLVKKLGIENFVQIIPGMLDQSIIRNFLFTSDIVVLPFKMLFSEPPLTVLEAMSLGKTVITTDVGSLSEIVNADRGVIIEPGEPDVLAQVILYLAEHPKKTLQLGKKAQQFVSTMPDWNWVTERLVRLLHEMAFENSVNY